MVLEVGVLCTSRQGNACLGSGHFMLNKQSAKVYQVSKNKIRTGSEPGPARAALVGWWEANRPNAQLSLSVEFTA